MKDADLLRYDRYISWFAFRVVAVVSMYCCYMVRAVASSRLTNINCPPSS